MRADLAIAARPAPTHLAVTDPPRVHRPEARRRQRQEHHRVLSDGLGHALAAAHPARDKLERVAPISARARRADGLAAVAAALQQRSVGLVVGGVGGHYLPCRRVERIDSPTKSNRSAAVTIRTQLTLEALPLVRVSGPREHAIELGTEDRAHHTPSASHL